jgi:2-polyprenyl-3-methyl-5-hydroxy-6-metoxy-1,4-benzoquinol methylase
MPTIDETVSAGAYATRVVRTLNNGFMTLMISIGHRTGLLDAMATLPPSTSTRIAEAADLNERYVREWLAAMTAAHIIDFEPKTATYRLPMEYAAVLTRNAGANNLATLAQFLPILASVEDLVVSSFRSGGGVHPEAFARFQEVMADERMKSVDVSYIEALVALMPGLRERLDDGAEVLDIGCGRGRVLNTMAMVFPASRFIGYDISREAIRDAREEAERWGLTNVDFEIGDVASLDDLHRFDLITAFDAVHDQAFPRIVLRNVARAIREDGYFLMQDVAGSSHLERNLEHPFAPLLYTVSTMHCVAVSLAEEGDALGAMWGEENARHMLYAAGFKRLRFERIATDPLNYYCVAMLGGR